MRGVSGVLWDVRGGYGQGQQRSGEQRGKNVSQFLPFIEAPLKLVGLGFCGTGPGWTGRNKISKRRAILERNKWRRWKDLRVFQKVTEDFFMGGSGRKFQGSAGVRGAGRVLGREEKQKAES